MKKHLLKNAILLLAVVFSTTLFAQDWTKLMQDPEANLFDVQKAFEKYRSEYVASYKVANNGAEPVKVPGHKIFKRWEWLNAPRASATGQLPAPGATWSAMENYKKGYDKPMAGAWVNLGPSSVSGIAGAGRLNFVRVHPTNSSKLFVGAPSGGLWISNDDGSTWTTNTDNLPSVIGCTDVAFDPINPNTMYMATGDGWGGDNYTVGILKSTDGAATWNTTGLSYKTSAYRQICKILVDPANGNNILAATTGGIYRSTDAAATWTMVQAGAFKDMEFKPGTAATIYASGTEVWRSTNNGVTWTKATGSIPAAASIQRIAIATTAADPNVLYAVVMKATTYDMEGIYKSTNSGASFGAKISTPNIGTQGFYDLCIAANPTNANEVLLGGQTQFLKSTNGGVAWTTAIGSMHVDFHDIVYTNGTTAYVTSDGGVWKSSSSTFTSWTNKSNGLNISQKYGFGHSATAVSPIIVGRQDNGTDLYNGASWGNTMGGDGMLCFVSWGSNSNMWGSQYNGSLNRSTNGGGSWSAMSGISEACPWVTEWNEDPNTAGTVYAGCANVWKATAGTFTKLSGNVAGTSTVSITAIAVSKANSLTMWAAKGGALYKSTNGGTSWTQQTAVPSGTITDIVCHNTDVNKAWISFSGYTNSLKVLQTADGGTTWTNLSASLPNIPVNCMANDKNGNDALYIGTDAGCFFKDATLSVWQPFSTGLPNVNISQIEMQYSLNKVRASSYGRGMWESTLYVAGAYPPDANFAGSVLIGCPGLGVQFTDYTAGSPTSWSWSFPGGSPSTSTQQNPFVAYNTPGTYSVSLTATNANGSDSQTFTSYISISSAAAAPTAAGKTICGPAPVSITATPSSGTGTVRWWNAPAGGSIIGTGNTYSATLWGTQTIYVDQSFPSANIDFVGAQDNTLGGGAVFTANDIRGLYFDVAKPVIINTVDVYATTAGMRTIEILDANGNWVTDTTVNIPASPTTPATVTINRTVYPGTNYFIKLRGLVDCYRNSDGAAYPYIDGGSSAVTITNSNAGAPGYYYFFYNWQFTNIICNTGRTAVLITDTCSLTGVNEIFANNQLDVYPNPNEGLFTVSFNTSTLDNYVVKVVNAIGQTVYEQKLENFSGKYSKNIDITTFRKGVYMLSVSNSKNETIKKVIVH